MSKLRAWYDQCADLWKGRKAKSAEQLADVASQMDAAFGPWDSKMGSRADAIQHVKTIGGAKALSMKDAAPGTPEHKAFSFMQDMKRYARTKVIKRAAMLPPGDTLTGAIDKEHIEHHAGHWARHNVALEHASRGGREVEVDGETMRGLRAGQKGFAPTQTRTTTVNNRVRLMKEQGHKSPYATMDDLNTIHTGVERAIAAGKVSEGSANRYHVMRAAMHRVHREHGESYPGLSFKPSYAAMDTEALKVMKTGVEHLHEQGFAEAKMRLTGMLGSAVESHGAHPWRSRARVREDHQTSVAYPQLHPMGSEAHQKQEATLAADMRALDRRRSGTSRSTPKPAAPAAPAPAAVKPAQPEGPAMPKSYDEYKTRRDAGENFPDSVHLGMAKLKRMNKSIVSEALLAAWKGWRGEAA